MNYSEKILNIRETSGLSIRKFAKLVGCSHTYIPQLESGISTSKKPLSPTIEILHQICNKSGYDFTLFLYETGYLSNDRIAITDEEIQLLAGFRSGKYEMEKSDILAKQKRINKL